MTPNGLADLLRRLRDTYPGLPPVAVTENGAAFTDALIDGRVADDRRITYLAEHLEAVGSAMDNGVDVFGYFVWSAFDNLEWHDGYGPRFGVDPRRLRDHGAHAQGQRAVAPRIHRHQPTLVAGRCGGPPPCH